ncbi:hypothetical protein KL942_003027 [Ogataea angusta]|uniref:BRCT domain-containing protein n=1 Tax=Pichia angusta TaxID=870730 RepID=A0ABQ7RQY3_PICAN|nr:hypothetical protein KL942_003027 [Ogataea angusta]KAG7845523.1 hypothetical protein KL941_003369 [Ogataea angusta]KAG7845923.1 hypothetical protein KL940_004968 [Ogataea angusta]KAG7857987.1 hypothetical protein KL919_003245 [Ogataea angusta]
MGNYKSLPFCGLKFCSTSINTAQKSTLAWKIEMLGGTFHNDLLSDINVLLVGSIDTPKYHFCAQRRFDIKFILPDTINTIYDLWTQNKEIDSSIINRFLLSPFHGMSICLSRLSNATSSQFHKDVIAKMIVDLGGNPTESLTPSHKAVVSIEKSGKRFEKAIEWGIPVVHPRWVTDSAQRGAVLQWKYYDISTLDPEMIGVGSCLVWDKLNRSQIDKECVRRKNDTLMDDTNVKLILQAERASSVPPESAQRANLRPALAHSGGHMFERIGFYLCGFSEDEQVKLMSVISDEGGEIVSDTSADVIVVPSHYSYSSVPANLKNLADSKGIKIVNEWFIERSLHYSRLCFDQWSVPRIHASLELSLKVAFSGFGGIELVHVEKILKSLGFSPTRTLDQSSDLLVINLTSIGLTEQHYPNLFEHDHKSVLSLPCPMDFKTTSSKTMNKISAARSWGIPVVSFAYIWKVTDTGNLPPFNDNSLCIFAPNPIENRAQVRVFHEGGMIDAAIKSNTENATSERNIISSLDGSVGSGLNNEHFTKLNQHIVSRKRLKSIKLAGMASKSRLKSLSSAQHKHQDVHFDPRISRRIYEIKVSEPQVSRSRRKN